MRNLFTILISFTAFTSIGQTWQSVGTAIGTNVTACDIAIDQSNGELWVAYVESATQKANVRKWNGSAWVLYGTSNFGTGTTMNSVKMQVFNGIPYVATQFTTAGFTYLRVYFWDGSAWDAMGSTNFQTPTAAEYSLKISSTGGVYLCFDNMTPAAGNLELIVDELSASSQAQIGGDVSDSYMDSHDFVMDPNDEPWVANEYGDMSNYVNISFNDFPLYGVQDAISNDDGGEIITNLIGSTDLRFAQAANDNSIVYTRYDLGSGLFSLPYSIYNSTVTDYDMASSTSLDYFFYTTGTTSFVESVNISEHKLH
ncbi:MAG: hypothetical protein IPM77_07045 [Crocinitomicaceae bacterium]|nr:hypothetical protein [Crocinitomicaceae bacterium]